MKLVFAIKSLNVSGGGAERVLVDVVNGLVDRGHAIKVLTFDFPGKAFYELLPTVDRLDMCISPPGRSTPRMKMISSLPRMRAAIVRERPEVVVAFMHSTYVPVAISLVGLGIPLIVSEHTESRHYDRRPLQRLLRRFVDGHAVFRTVPSEGVRRGFSHESIARTLVVPNPVGTRISCVERLQYYDSPRVVLSVGRLMEEKDHSVLIDAFFQVSAEFPSWRLLILGDGPLRADLERQVQRLGLTNRVDMPGFTYEVHNSYMAADFLVVSSRYEAFGMVAAEALAASCPVLCFDDCAGVADIVKNGRNGILVPGGRDRKSRVLALAGGLRLMMRDKELRARLACEGPASVSHYETGAVLDRWEEILEEAVDERGAS